VRSAAEPSPSWMAFTSCVSRVSTPAQGWVGSCRRPRPTSPCSRLHSRVLQLGTGGLRSNVLQSLAGLGVGRLTVLEHDVVEPRNFARQFPPDIGYRPLQGAPRGAVDAGVRLKDPLLAGLRASGAPPGERQAEFARWKVCSPNHPTREPPTHQPRTNNTALTSADVQQRPRPTGRQHGRAVRASGITSGLCRPRWPLRRRLAAVRGRRVPVVPGGGGRPSRGGSGAARP
jgi:hypothetical protein